MTAVADARAPRVALCDVAPPPLHLVRIATCGSVDDGKSTLIGRLLHDAHAVPADQLEALRADSRRFGTRGTEPDFALLLDGLSAEREQGITIDVAHRYFTTRRHRFVIADSPGHVQYTRNMMTAASTADVAVVLADASRGLQPQTRRHLFLLGMLGVGRVVLAVNKMDLAGRREQAFGTLVESCRPLFGEGQDWIAIPVVATLGENVVAKGEAMPWYRGPTLLEALEATPTADERARQAPFRMPVQRVRRDERGARGLCGTVVSGVIRRGDTVRLLPGGVGSRVARIRDPDGEVDQAVAEQAVVITLADDLDASHGDLVCEAERPAGVADQFEATLVWMGEAPLLRGRTYLMKLGTRTVNATVNPVKYRIDTETLARTPAESLAMNETGVCELELDRAVPFDAYRDNRDTGGFILIDRIDHRTVGAGMLSFALRRAHNLAAQAPAVDRLGLAALKGHRPCVVWLTGLSGAGKSTIANRLQARLHELRCHTYVLDGDNLRQGLNRDLGFSDADRVENIRRATEVARILVDAGLIVLAAFISPFRAERRAARDRFAPGEFVEVFVETPLQVAEARDPKGLYRKARAGLLPGFTGVDAPYEAPEHPELRIDTATFDAHQAAEVLVEFLRHHGFLRPASAPADPGDGR
jgi:bifunctional enzyme CysN/CysC